MVGPPKVNTEPTCPSVQGGVNWSVPNTINTLGGGLAVVETITTDVGNCGGVTSYRYKTLSTDVGKRGGLTSKEWKTLITIVGKCGGPFLIIWKTLTNIMGNCLFTILYSFYCRFWRKHVNKIYLYK